MIERAKAGRYDLIVVKDVCDFMRNAKLTFELIDELEKCDVSVYVVNTGIWSFNKDDFFKSSLLASYEEQESREISGRVCS